MNQTTTLSKPPTESHGQAKLCQVGTIQQIRERLLEDGYYVSDAALRLWVKQGLIPAIHIGTVRVLVRYDVTREIVDKVTAGELPQPKIK